MIRMNIATAAGAFAPARAFSGADSFGATVLAAH